MCYIDQLAENKKNWLPIDGRVNYYGKLYNQKEADHFMEILLRDTDWQNDEIIIFGNKITTKRKVAWYGDKKYRYTYSNTTRIAMYWTSTLLQLKNKVEQRTGDLYNSCLLNLYHDGSEGMSWHSDNEKELKKNGAIASLSFGAERKFSFKHNKSKEKVDIILQHGSLLVMRDQTQSYWQHMLPKTKKITTPRINLTFRTIIDD